MNSSHSRFPLKPSLIAALLVGFVYFVPQLFYYCQWQAPQVLLEENYDEIVYAVWVSRAAGEHPAQPSPYQISSQPIISASFANLQFFPTWFLGSASAILRQPSNAVLLIGSLIFPVLIGIAFAYFTWQCGVKDPAGISLSVTFSLLILPPPLWYMEYKYITALLTGVSPGFSLSLPYSRRYQPQFTAVIHYLTIVASLAILQTNRRKYILGLTLLTAAGFGLSFYCYYFSWTILFGWLLLGSIPVAYLYPEKFKAWVAAALIGLLIAIPFFWQVFKSFDSLSQSAASAPTREVPTDPAIWIMLFLSVALLSIMRFDKHARYNLWALFILCTVIMLGALQNVITGIYIQPYHYVHYFGRPISNLVILLGAVWVIRRWVLVRFSISIAGYFCYGAMCFCIVTALLFQCAHYFEVSSSGRKGILAQGAMKAVRAHLPPGSVIYCPDEAVREIIPLYTDAISFFSRYMLLEETDSTHAVISERAIISQWLLGINREGFAGWIAAKPVDVFFQVLQYPPNAATKLALKAKEKEFIESFDRWNRAPNANALEPLSGALMPKSLNFNQTRLNQHFQCTAVWEDSQYTLYTLKSR